MERGPAKGRLKIMKDELEKWTDWGGGVVLEEYCIGRVVI